MDQIGIELLDGSLPDESSKKIYDDISTYTPPETHVACQNSAGPKKKASSSNHPFSGANLLLVSGRVRWTKNVSKHHWKPNVATKVTIWLFQNPILSQKHLKNTWSLGSFFGYIFKLGHGLFWRIFYDFLVILYTHLHIYCTQTLINQYRIFTYMNG